jgi:Arc/MetJ-type ribon-helix-helix transcriptional regulator
MSEGYVSVSLPKSFVNKIDELMENSDLGYSSRAEVIKDAVRDLLLKYGINFDVSKNENEKEKKD